MPRPPRPLIRKVDCVSLPVRDLDEADMSKGALRTDDQGNVVEQASHSPSGARQDGG
jgi:hypothetical protein